MPAVRSENVVGQSEYSETFSFTTGFPAAPALITPAFQELDVELNPVFTWADRDDATGYRLQLYNGLSVTSSSLLVDTILTDATFELSKLSPSTFYSWRVQVSNPLGTSVWSDIYQFKTLSIIPEVPQIVSPVNGIDNVGHSIVLKWQTVQYANEYRLQVAYDENFSQIFLSQNVIDSAYTVEGLSGETIYNWRVGSKNNSGSSEYSPASYFVTGFPGVPTAVYPLDQTLEVSITPEIRWLASKVAESYNFQLAEDVSLNLNKLIVDTLVTDSVYKSHSLKLSTIHTYRIKANNSIGESDWTEGIRFKTTADTTTGVEESLTPEIFAVYQNYPNPFNPSTLITFDIVEREYTTLKVYNVLGQEIIQLINEELNPGRHTVDFNSQKIPGGLPSGIYVYVLNSGKNSQIRKMMLLK